MKDEEGESEKDMFSDWLGWMRRKGVAADEKTHSLVLKIRDLQ